MAEALNTLEVLELNEVSFVPAGDNPDAGVCLMKRRATTSPPPEKPMPDGTTDPEVAKRDNDEIAKLNARIAAFEKREAIGDIEKRIAPHLPATLAPDLYEIGKAAPEAAKRIEAEMLKLAQRAAAVEKLTAPIGGPGAPAATDAGVRLEKAVATLIEKKGLTRAAAITEAIRLDPTLYTDSTMGA